MADSGGHWAAARLPDGTTRQDWVPDRQPPPADGPPGNWHIVRDGPQAPSRWEWHPTTDAVPAAKPVPLRWSLTAAAAGTAMVLTFVAITVFGGSSDSPAEAVAADPSTDQPLRTNSGNQIDSASSTDDKGPTDSAAVVGSTPGRHKDAGSPQPTPTTWAQEIVAARPNDSIRLTPVASDWTAENIVIGKDLAGNFLGRVSVRYSGPGTAAGRFAVRLLSDGKEITTLTGELVEVRSGVYQVMLSTAASWVDGPWTTEFKVLSTN